LQRFAIRDQSLSDEQLLKSRLQAAEGVQLVRVAEFAKQEWRQSGKVRMVQTFGLQVVQELTLDVADFIVKMDGSSSLSELVDALAAEAAVPRDQVQAECLSIVRRWLDRGFVRQMP
jgi:hypothetical protein